VKDNPLLWGFILAGAAVGLLCLELLVPSGGLLGLMCGMAAIGSIVFFFTHDATFGWAALLLYVILGPVLVVFVFKAWFHSPLARQMVLGGEDETMRTQEESARESDLARKRRMEQIRRLVGAQGMCVSDLRPVGVVKIDGQRLDAMAETGIIDAGTPVVVTDVYDNQVKVRPQSA